MARRLLARRIALGALALAGAASCEGASAIFPPMRSAGDVRDAPPSTRPPQPEIAQAVFHRGLLWLLGADGSLAAADVERDTLSYPLDGERVVDIHRTLDDRFWVLSQTDLDVHLWERVDGGFKPLLEIASPASPLLALSDVEGNPAILAGRAVYFVGGGGKLQVLSLDEEVKPGLVPHVSFAVTAAGTAYAGVNNGEWGGALYRIELSSGDVQIVRRVDGKDICSGPLNPSCDPVTSIIVDPDAPSCVLVGIGLRHFIESGRLLQVCGTKVRRVLVRAVEEPPWPKGPVDERLALAAFFGELGRVDLCAIDPDACPADAKADSRARSGPAVFGLSRTRQGYWMVTGGSLSFVRKGRAKRVNPPLLERHCGILLGSTNGVLGLTTDMNWRASVSGDTPLIAVTSLDGAPESSDLEPYPALRARLRGSPPGTCWLFDDDADTPRKEGDRAQSRALCFEEDRYFAKDERGWTTGLLRWIHEADGAWTATLSERESVRVAISGKYAMAIYAPSLERRRTLLRRAAGEELALLKKPIEALPKVESVCGPAVRCHAAALFSRSVRTVEETRIEEEHAEGEEPRYDEAPPYDLRGCGAWLAEVQRQLHDASARGAAGARDHALEALCRADGAPAR